MHGFSLNVSPELSDFSGIVPCGLKDRGVTSMAALGVAVSVEAMRPLIVDAFAEVMGYATVQTVPVPGNPGLLPERLSALLQEESR
jgi:lipoyl(octanoyl) transferase